jgi:hypothetical protein
MNIGGAICKFLTSAYLGFLLASHRERSALKTGGSGILRKAKCIYKIKLIMFLK